MNLNVWADKFNKLKEDLIIGIWNFETSSQHATLKPWRNNSKMENHKKIFIETNLNTC